MAKENVGKIEYISENFLGTGSERMAEIDGSSLQCPELGLAGGETWPWPEGSRGDHFTHGDRSHLAYIYMVPEKRFLF